MRLDPNAAPDDYRASGRHGDLAIRPGHFVQLTLHSLVETRWFESEHARFHALDGFIPFSADDDADYISAASTRQRFEGAPVAPAPDALDKLELELELVDAGATQADSLSLRLTSASAVGADWLHAMRYMPYDFHWAGYPIDFPSIDAELVDWLTAHANANSERPDLQGVAMLETSFGASTVDQWRVGRAVPGGWVAGLAERTLRAGPRPATQTGYVARPVARFRKWLAALADVPPSALSPLALEARPLAAGHFVDGVAPALDAQRLPVPSLRLAPPLTATGGPGEAVSAAPPPRQQNGNLLVFDEAIRRTDDLTAVGGIGEVIEVDLLISNAEGHALPKIGRNPIFHPAPADDPVPPGLRCHRPFGLTYDQSDNGLVAQTGMIVVPENSKGEWLLAEVRIRRLILPEVLKGTRLHRTPIDTHLAALSGAQCYRVALRRDGQDFVPLDFCVDVASREDGQPPLTTLSLRHGAQACPQQLDVGAAAFGLAALPCDGYRLLLSWHKGRWGTQVEWRVQVLLQQRAQDRLEWHTLGHKSDCAANGAVVWANGQAHGELLLEADPAMGGVLVVPMSDYTPGMWLHFIGGFGKEPVDPEALVLRRAADNLLSLESLPGAPRVRPACIALPATAGGATVEFNCLLVYRPLRDMSCTPAPAPGLADAPLRSDAGALLGAWRYDGAGFVPLDHGNRTLDLDGCFAYLCTFQYISSPSHDEHVSITRLLDAGKASTRGLIELLFPDQRGQARESLVRMLPKVLGQIGIAGSSTTRPMEG